ncbi:MAG TPA: TIM barrel protein [bacterium]|nr:TIM barrel protein [bacterium]HQL61435.1 TIM barrel protein [bacterium]
MIRLSGFGDEITSDFEGQLRHLVEMKINFIELRGLWGTGILELSAEQQERARSALRQYGIKVAAIGSPIGKVPVTDPAEKEIARFRIAVERARYFSAPNIRVFSFYLPKGEDPQKYRQDVLDRIRAMVEIAEKEGIVMMLENEADLYGEKAVYCADLLNTIDSPHLKMAFDPANFVCAGQHPVDECLPLVRRHIAHVHIKDARLGSKEMTLAGEGDGQIPELVRALKEDGYSGFITMEPHLAEAGRSSGFSGPELFAKAVQSFCKILDAEGLEYRQIRTAIIGTGNIGAFHARATLSVHETHLIAVCDTVRENAEKLAAELKVAAYSDLGEMLARKDLDAVHVCTPSGLHGANSIAAMKAGKHVLCEKPMEITLERADAMIDTARKAGVKLGIISQHRFNPNIRKVKEAVESGRFGVMVLGDASIKWYRPQSYYDSGAWRGTWEMDGGGCLMNQGIHYIDMLQWIMGPVNRVFARTNTRARNIEVEDIAIASLEFENGAFGNIMGSTCIYPGMPERLEIHGTKGSAVVEKSELTFWEVEGEEEKIAGIEKKDSTAAARDPMKIDASGHQAQIRDFAHAILENRDPAIPGTEGRRPLEIILAVYESGKSGREVTLPLPSSFGSPNPDII